MNNIPGGKGDNLLKIDNHFNFTMSLKKKNDSSLKFLRKLLKRCLKLHCTATEFNSITNEC